MNIINQAFLNVSDCTCKIEIINRKSTEMQLIIFLM